jgi:hypothetical protein
VGDVRQDDDLNDLKDRITLTARECERLTGVKSGTFLYWAWRDQDREPEDKIGPPSFLAGRRRLWMRDGLLQWLEDAQKRADHDVPAKPQKRADHDVAAKPRH